MSFLESASLKFSRLNASSARLFISIISLTGETILYSLQLYIYYAKICPTQCPKKRNQRTLGELVSLIFTKNISRTRSSHTASTAVYYSLEGPRNHLAKFAQLPHRVYSLRTAQSPSCFPMRLYKVRVRANFLSNSPPPLPTALVCRPFIFSLWLLDEFFIALGYKNQL